MGERDPACGMAWLDDYKIVTVNGIAVIYLAEGDKGNNEPQTEMLEIVYPWDVEGKKKRKGVCVYLNARIIMPGT